MLTPHSASGPIVVGVERSERSRDALALGRTLAGSLGRELLLVTVQPADGRSAVMPPAALEWAARPLGELAERARAISHASVSRGLLAVAQEEDALAIVVGPSHRGALGHVVPGSVGERLLRSAPCPVAVAPSGYRSAVPTAIRHVGVGFAPTPEADEALAAAVGIAARTGAAVRVLSVVEPPAAVGSGFGFGWGYGELERTARDDLAASLASTIAEVGSGVEIDGEVVDGYADDELARLSADVDLLVCGSRRLGALGRVMLGSVSAGVMRKARCPVLVVPRGAPEGFADLRTAPEAPQRRHLAVATAPRPGRSS